MIQLEQHDLRPLESFVYLWRWTDRNHNVLPASDLAQIHLTEHKCKSTCGVSVRMSCTRASVGLTNHLNVLYARPRAKE